MWEPDTPAAQALKPAVDRSGTAIDDDCGEPLFWESSGTLQVCVDPRCPDHDQPVFPLLLTSCGRPADDLRREATPDELLDEKLRRAALRKRLLAWIDERLEDDQLHSDTVGHLEEVFRPEVKQAQSLKQLGWLAEKLFALPIRTLAPAPRVIQAEVISDGDTADVQHPGAVVDGPGLRELGRQALASLTSGAGDGVAAIPRLALPAAGQAPAGAVYAAYVAPLGFCDRCAELRQQGRHSGLFGVAVVRVEFRGLAGLQLIDNKPHPVLCQDCWDWLRTTQPAGSYAVTDQAATAAARPLIAGRTR